MSLPEHVLVLPSISTRSLNDLPVDCPRPLLGDRTMSLPQMRERLLSFRSHGMKRRKVSQKNVTTSSRSLHPQDDATATKGCSAASSTESQATAAIVPQGPHSDQPSRKRDVVLHWLEKQRRHFDRLRKEFLARRDSMFDSRTLEQELRIASESANAVVLGPHGEPVPQLVIDIFFRRYPAGGSEWRSSALWESHLADFFAWKGFFVSQSFQDSPDYALSQRYLALVPHRLPPVRSPSPPIPSRPLGKRDLSFSLGAMWPGSGKRRQKRGKSPAPAEPDEICSSLVDDKPLSPRTQSPGAEKMTGAETQENTTQVAQNQPTLIRCASVSEPLDTSLIAVLPAADLKPASSEGLDLSNLAHCTGRPNEDPSPIELLSFPLAAPSVPQLRPKQRITPIPPLEQLDYFESVQFEISPILSPGRSASNVQRWPSRPPNVPRTATRFTADDDTIADNLSYAGAEIPRIKPYPSPAPAVQLPPTPPDSRHNSTASQGPPHTASSAIPSPPAEPTTPDGPADRNRATCTLSDTTGSSLPDCPIFVSRADHVQRLREYWAGYAKRHGPGMRNWR